MTFLINNNTGSGHRTILANLVIQIAIVFNFLVTICPIVDYYANWYVSMIPVIIVMLFLIQDMHCFVNAVKVLILGLILVLFQFWFTHRNVEFSSFLINGMISWSPCLISLLCTNMFDSNTQKGLLQIALIFFIITSITTIKGLIMFPFAARELAGAAIGFDRERYMLLNIGGYEYIYALVIGLPVFIWIITNSKGLFKLLNIGTLWVCLYCIYMSAYATALIITIVVLALVVIDFNPRLKPYLIFSGIVFLIFARSGILSSIVEWIITFVESDYVVDRLQQVAFLLQGQSIDNINTNTTNERLVLMRNAMNGFISCPLWGNNWIDWHKGVLSGHSMILDILSSSGIFGFVIYVVIFMRIFKIIFQVRFKNVMFYVRIIWFAFIAVTVMNPSSFSIIYLIIFTFASMINNIEHNTKNV